MKGAQRPEGLATEHMGGLRPGSWRPRINAVELLAGGRSVIGFRRAAVMEGWKFKQVRGESGPAGDLGLLASEPPTVTRCPTGCHLQYRKDSQWSWSATKRY